MTRVAIVQSHGVHEAVIPSLIDALGPECTTHVWINDQSRATLGDLFAEMPGLGADILHRPFTTADEWKCVEDEIADFAPDLVLSSTFQADGPARFVERLGRPTLGVVHNVRKAHDSDVVMEMMREGRALPLVLAHHVAGAWHTGTAGAWLDRLGVIEPVCWGPAGTPDPSTRIVAVPGGVNAQNRDFAGLLEAVRAPDRARAMAAAGMCVHILGGGPDRAAMETEIKREGLGNLIRFAPLGGNGRVHYDEYVAVLRRSWAILPLIPLKKTDYRRFKITSTVSTAAAFGVPIVLDHWTAAVYRCPSLVSDGHVAAALDALLGLDKGSHAALSAETAAYRDRMMVRNRQEMARLMGYALR